MDEELKAQGGQELSEEVKIEMRLTHIEERLCQLEARFAVYFQPNENHFTHKEQRVREILEELTQNTMGNPPYRIERALQAIKEVWEK